LVPKVARQATLDEPANLTTTKNDAPKTGEKFGAVVLGLEAFTKWRHEFNETEYP